MAEADEPRVERRDPRARATRTEKTRARVLREAREAAGLKQSQLGARIDRSASFISRLENPGYTYELSLDDAQKLAEATNAPHIVELATSPNRTDGSTTRLASDRGDVLRGILRDRMIDRLDIVVADEIDLVDILREARENLPVTDTKIVFPTRKRQRELEAPVAVGRSDGEATYSWNVQNQINQIFNATSRDSVEHIGADLTLYESDAVLSSFALVGSTEGLFCVCWPNFGSAVRHVPAVVSNTPDFLADMEDRLDAALSERQPLTHLKAVAILDELSGPATDHRHELTGFFTLGSDSEASIVARRRTASQVKPATAGFAVSLVLVHGVVPRVDRGLGRRLLLPWDEKSKSYELFATHVSSSAFESESDERAALRPRGHMSATSAAERVADINLENGYSPGYIGPEVFRRAATRWILDEYNVVVPPDELVEVKLPPELRIVTKDEGRLPVLPRLFQLDVSPKRAGEGGADSAAKGHSGVQSQPDFRDKLRRAFHHDRDVLEVGLADLSSTDITFNNFIEMARTFNGGWLLDEAKELGITEQ